MRGTSFRPFVRPFVDPQLGSFFLCPEIRMRGDALMVGNDWKKVCKEGSESM